MVEQEVTYQLQLQEKEKIISNLELTKSNLNIKKIGEQLELWCNTEYENYAQCGFETCSWERIIYQSKMMEIPRVQKPIIFLRYMQLKK